MKPIPFFLLVALVMFFGCVASQPTGPGMNSSASVSSVARILDTAASTFWRFADSTNGNPWQAIMLTGNWLQTQPNVQSVDEIDSTYIYITLKSGLLTIFSFDQVDDTGHSLFRGGSFKYSGGSELEPRVLSTHTITNKKVLIFSPPYDEFYGGNDEMQKVLGILNNSTLGLDVTLLKGAQCAFDVVNTFPDYGLVILDTHGEPDGFKVGGVDTTSDTSASISSQTEEQLKVIANEHAGPDAYNQILVGNLTLAMSVKVNLLQGKGSATRLKFKVVGFNLNAKYLATIPNLSNTVVFGNMCYSGYNTVGPEWPTPIRQAFLAKNPISYFCYRKGDPRMDISTTVTDPFAHQMEDSLLTQLVTNRDSTGDAYLKSDGSQFWDTYGRSSSPLYLSQYGAIDYSYFNCGDTLVDPRDGQKYPTVCIGNQVWMAQNLNYDAPGSVVYNNDPTNGPVYGRLYNWATLMQGASGSSATPSGVQGVCPKGWHIPSDNEFALMVSTFGNSVTAGGALKSTSTLWQSPNAGATNISGFSGLPAGTAYNDGTNTTFNGLGINAQFGTTTLRTVGTPSVVWVLDAADPSTGSTGSSPLTANSCRCVKDP